MDKVAWFDFYLFSIDPERATTFDDVVYEVGFAVREFSFMFFVHGDMEYVYWFVLGSLDVLVEFDAVNFEVFCVVSFDFHILVLHCGFVLWFVNGFSC